MTAKQNRKGSYRLRAKIPLIMRGVALLGLVVTILFIGVGFYRGSSHAEFRLKPQHTQLSDNVVGVVKGYERRETENGILKYYIKADKATTFSDEHQELENVVLEVFDKSGLIDLEKAAVEGDEVTEDTEKVPDGNNQSDKEKSDKVTAKKAIYIPEEGKDNFTIYFAGDVNVETRNKLKVKSEQIVYSKKTEIAESEVLVEFERENISGKSLGAILNIKKKTLELLKEVEIIAVGKENTELADSNIRRAKIKAGHALVEQIPETIKSKGGVDIALTPKSHVNGRLTQPTDIKSEKATAYFKEKEVKKIDLEGNVYIFQKATKTKPNWTKTRAKRAIATIDGGEPTKLELFDNVRIDTTESDQKLTTITGNLAFYDQVAGYVSLNGNSQVKQGNDLIRGEILHANLYPDKKVKDAKATGNAFLRQQKLDRTTEVSAPELQAFFGQNRELQKANALGNSEVVVTPSKVKEYTRLNLSAPNAINLDFRVDGTLKTMKTQGRTTIKLNAPNSSPDSANKTLTADTVNTILRPNGKELENAQAIGNAILFVEPLRIAPANYRSTVKAPRFDCEFYDQNNARQCIARTGTKTVRIPTLPSKTRQKQILNAAILTTIFDPETQDVQRFDAEGNAKFTEGDRNGIARTITYTANDEIVRLRGGEPTLWNSDARVRSREIDWDTKSDRSRYRGKVRATYYSQKRTGDATPFGKTNSPVFFTSNTADFDHKAETATFIGRARSWQGNNYVRANRLFLEQKQGRFTADGKVQSALYEAERTVGGKKTKTTVYASSNKMMYQRLKNLLRYEEKVDIRQGSDRLRGGLANIYLDSKGELIRTIIEKNVVITQPNRRATGNYAKYTAASEVVVLRGNPATIRDSENGSSQGREMTVNLKTNRMVGKGKTKKNSTGRIRSVYKIKDGKLN